MESTENEISIDCNLPPLDLGLPKQNHDPRSMIGILTSLDGVELVDYDSAMEHRIPLNSNVLDFYLENPNLIPKSWDLELGVIFAGTSHFSEVADDMVMRTLAWKGRKRENGVSWHTYGVETIIRMGQLQLLPPKIFAVL